MDMKKLIANVIFILAVLLAKGQSTQTSELQQAETTIQLYFNGWATGDTSKIGKAMHGTCHLKSFRDGQFTDMTRAEYLGRFKPRLRPDGLTTRIVALDMTDNIASAKTEIDTGKDVFTDYFNLIKTNEGWFIVDKVAVRKLK
jgi:aldose sugar dehydrogenase